LSSVCFLQPPSLPALRALLGPYPAVGMEAFPAALVKHLRTPGLEVRQMLTRVRADVLAATQKKQVPWDNSSLLGEVFLAAARR